MRWIFRAARDYVNEELIVSPGPNDPGKRAFETLKPVIGTVADAPDAGCEILRSSYR